MPAAFVDTNILLYAASNHPSEREKSRTAIASARELGCARLFSEGFHHGQDYEGVMVINPFHV